MHKINANSLQHSDVDFYMFRYLKKLTKLQLMRMLTLIKDNLNGLTLAESLKKSEELDRIDPNEDLNKVLIYLLLWCYDQYHDFPCLQFVLG